MQKKIIHIIILLFFGLGFTFSQDSDPILIFSGRVTDSYGKKLDGVQVIVKKDNQPFKQNTTSGGKYDAIEAPFGFVYSITFKKNGFVPKSLVLDAKKGFFKEDVEPRTFIEPSISLFLEESEVDYSIVTNSPVGKARIDPSTGKIDWDYTYLGQRKNEIEKFLKQIEDQEDIKISRSFKIKNDNIVSKQLANAKEFELANAQNQINKYIKTGDNSLSSLIILLLFKLLMIRLKILKSTTRSQGKRNCFKIAKDRNQHLINKAIELYNEAPKLILLERINEINSLLATQKSNEEEYNNLIAKADNQFTNKPTMMQFQLQKSIKIKPNEIIHLNK